MIPCWRLRSGLLESLLRALSAAISREKARLSGHLGYVAKLCTNVRGVILVIREACADLDSCYANGEYRSRAFYLSRDMMLITVRFSDCYCGVRLEGCASSLDPAGSRRRLAACQTGAVLTIAAFETCVLRLVTRVGLGRCRVASQARV